jgi:MoaA/NifB/PqqE/SkfB family radical SAM enzyme
MLYHFNEIKTIHLEITDSCNAACPMCARNINGGEDNPQLPNTELYLDDVKKIFTPEFIKQLDRLYMCGNYGDPIAARDTLEVFDYFRQCNSRMNLSMHTNGSAKKPEWWSELAKVLGKNSYVVFSLDGLEDTNHLYRQNTIWSKIMQNAQAFIDAGGRARWDYIVFEHNEHQVEEARQLSQKMGFEKFQFKKSARFFSNASGMTKDAHQAANRKGTTTLLKPPVDSKYRNLALEELSKIDKKTDDTITFVPRKADEAFIVQGKQKFYLDPNKKKPMEKYWDEVSIKCKVAEEKSLYVSAEGIVQPCCWTAGQMYVWYWEPKGSQIWQAINQIGKDNLNAKQHSLESIVNGLYFQDIVPNSWNKSSCAEGKLQVCAKTCGVKNDMFNNQFAG